MAHHITTLLNITWYIYIMSFNKSPSIDHLILIPRLTPLPISENPRVTKDPAMTSMDASLATVVWSTGPSTAAWPLLWFSVRSITEHCDRYVHNQHALFGLISRRLHYPWNPFFPCQKSRSNVDKARVAVIPSMGSIDQPLHSQCNQTTV